METADVVVVGGGIIGMSIAYQIARRSDMSVVVLDKGAGLGEGSTGGSAAITRQRYSLIENVRIARDANVVFRNWAEFTGLASPRAIFHPIGVLWMLDDDPAAVAADHARLAAEGIDVAILDPSDVHEEFPALSTCMVPFDLTGEVPHECRDGEAFLLERDTGFFDATGALEDLAEAARARGVEVRLRSEVTEVTVAAGRATGVVLADGTRLSAGTVVNAAGPWCNRVSAMAGIELPWELVPTRIQVMYRDLPPEVPRPLPVVGDAAGGIYFRPEASDQQIVAGSILEEDEREATDPDRYDHNADRVFVETKIHALHHRIPSLPHRGRLGGMAGLYTVNRQDVLPIVGPTELEGFVVANGFSGHGFKESPMVGAMVAAYLTGERAEYDTDVPMSFFAVDREPRAVEDKTVLA